MTPVIERLLALCRQYPGLDPRDVLEAVANPQWGEAARTNDWRQYVCASVVELWPGLSQESRLVSYLSASVAAHFE